MIPHVPKLQCPILSDIMNELQKKFLDDGYYVGAIVEIFSIHSQSIENQKLYNISKNQALKSIRRGDMGFPPFFDFKKVLFLP